MSTPSISLRQTSAFPRLAVWVLASLSALACLVLLLPLNVRILFVDSASILISLVAAWFLFRRATGSLPQFFLFLGLALTLHSALMAANLLAKHGLPWLSLGSNASFLLHLISPLLQGIAVFGWPTSAPGRILRWREFLDALLFTNSILLVFWLLGLGELVSNAPLSTLQKTAQLMVFLDYSLLMGLAIYRGLNAPGRLSNALGWLLGTFFLVTAGNLTWVGLNLRGAYYAGHPMDAIFLLISGLYLLVALAPLPVESASGGAQPSRLGSLLVPYLPFLAALPLIAYRITHLSNIQDSVALCLGTGMMALLLVRQLIALRDSYLVSRNLEAQVQQRTHALEESQAMLLRTQRMNLLATLGAGLAHDLNNLISVISMTTDLLEEDLDAGAVPARKDLGMLRSASTQAGELVKKLMAFGRRGEAQPQVFDLRERVQGMAKILEKLATPSVHMRCDLGSEPLLLKLDPIQIEQILVNLVANARDAMPQGGSIKITTHRFQTADGPRARLSISDSGSGIPEENLGRLFDAFFTTKEPGKGTGLGLASVKAIVDECGATISVASRLGAGTTFDLQFPLAED